MMRRASLVAGALLVGVVVLAGAVSIVWTPFDPGQVRASQRLLPAGGAHPMGTDGYGRDIFSRILAGSGSCLLVGVVSVSIAAVVGVPLGLVGGMSERWWARLVLRASDLLYAFPALLLAILLAAALGASTVTGMVAIGVATIPVFTRITRAGALQVMSQDYVVASRASGTTWPTVAVRHVLRNIAPLIGVQASVSFAMAILAEAALSYLGLATPPTVPTWGRMLYDAQSYLFIAPGQAFWPGLAIAAAVGGFNLLGDGLRDLLDPRLREVN